ncbi:MAG: PsbP-related protein [Chitinophagales bacterium]
MKAKNNETGELYNLYENKERGFSIKYPNGWVMIEKFQGADVIFFRPEKIFKKGFRDNVNVNVQSVSNEDELKNYAQVSMERLKTLIPGFTLVSERESAVSDLPSYEVTYTGAYKKKQELKWMQVIVKKGNQIYIITCAAIKDAFEGFLKNAQPMIDSFKLS